MEIAVSICTKYRGATIALLNNDSVTFDREIRPAMDVLRELIRIEPIIGKVLKEHCRIKEI